MKRTSHGPRLMAQICRQSTCEHKKFPERLCMSSLHKAAGAKAVKTVSLCLPISMLNFAFGGNDRGIRQRHCTSFVQGRERESQAPHATLVVWSHAV